MSFNNETLPWQKFFDGLDPKDPIKVLANSIGAQRLEFEVEFSLCAQLAMLRQLREINSGGPPRMVPDFQGLSEGPAQPILAKMSLRALREQVCQMCRQLDPDENSTADKVVLQELCRQMERLSQNLGDISAQLRRHSVNGTNGTNGTPAEESTADL